MNYRIGFYAMVVLSTALAGALLVQGVTPSETVVAIDTMPLRRQLDSVIVALDTARARYYRARTLYQQEVEVTAHMQARVLYYAGIVRRRPASSKFMVAWVRRAFAEARDPSIPPLPADSM